MGNGGQKEKRQVPGTGTYRFSLGSVTLPTRLHLRCQPATEKSPCAASGRHTVSRRSPTAQQRHREE
jgi:hypothetical protein